MKLKSQLNNPNAYPNVFKEKLSKEDEQAYEYYLALLKKEEREGLHKLYAYVYDCSVCGKLFGSDKQNTSKLCWYCSPNKLGNYPPFKTLRRKRRLHIKY